MTSSKHKCSMISKIEKVRTKLWNGTRNKTSALRRHKQRRSPTMKLRSKTRQFSLIGVPYLSLEKLRSLATTLSSNNSNWREPVPKSEFQSRQRKVLTYLLMIKARTSRIIWPIGVSGAIRHAR